MTKTKIEWCDYTLNPVKGLCPVGCSYCYARAMYKRFKWNPEIRYDSNTFAGLASLKKPSRIFVGSTFELFGDWVRHEWLEDIFMIAQTYPQHTFIFLTKQPQNLIKWSPFPENCWVGVSATNYEMFTKGCDKLAEIEASVKFISFEPLLHFKVKSPLIQARLFDGGIGWVIIGQQTPVKKATMPKIGWIQEILVACDNPINIPVFMKNNLKPLLVCQWAGWKLRQEFPRV